MSSIPNMFKAAIVFIVGLIISIFLVKPLTEIIVDLTASNESKMIIYIVTFVGVLLLTFVYGFIILKQPESN